MSRAVWGMVFAALLLASPEARAGETACSRFYRDFFDRAGIEHSRGLDPTLLASLEQLARARPERCGPGDYRSFIGRYADLISIFGADGFADAEVELVAIALTLAPRQVAPPLYEAAFQAFLDVRTRLAAHLTPAAAAEALGLFDEARPLELLPSRDLAADRDGILTGLTEVRRLLALGEVAAADARAQEMLRTLQAMPPADPDGGPRSP